MKNLLFIVSILISLFATAQDNLQSYTPSILFSKGEWEFKSFQNLYTQTKQFGSSRLQKELTGRGRETYFTSINQFLYGVHSKINVGFDVWVKNVSLENGTHTSRTAITGFGPKVKIAPFEGLKRLSIQSSVLFPLAKDLEGRSIDAPKPFLFLEPDRTLWLTQFFFDKQLNEQWQLFFQQAFWYNFVRDSYRANNYLSTQTSVFISYFPTTRWTFYAMSEYFPTHYNDSPTVQSGEAFYADFIQSGLGTKYQLVPNMIELELLYTNFWAGSEANGAGQTFNLGLRFIRQ
jgi:hypothetical protein